ncbi:unnamed protein product [Orchesella dallaii]|uniref:Uncharacterized protein n=1 Tax=Orchesella dallaii TaxID=48710 RepID=A0ABP1RN30_9HEXA
MEKPEIIIILILSTLLNSTLTLKSLNLSINTLKYNVCTIYVDTSTLPLQRSVDIEVLLNIAQENQGTLDLLWIFIKTALPKVALTKDGNLTVDESKHVAEQGKHSERSCNIILTDLSPIVSLTSFRVDHELAYFYIWRSILFGIAGGRNFPLNGKPTILFALTYYRFWGINSNYRDAALTSPVLFFIIEVARNPRIPMISCKWVCIHCGIDKELFHVQNPFKSLLSKFLLEAYPQPTHLERFQKRPHFATELWPAKGSEFDKIFCRYPTIEIARNILQFAEQGIVLNLCMQPNAVIIYEMSKILNFTMIYGGIIPPGGDVYHFKGLLVQVTAIQNYKFGQGRSAMEWGQGLDENIMEDTAFWQYSYCEPKQKFSSHDIFRILGGSFDTYTWLGISGSVILLYTFSKLTYLNNGYNSAAEIFVETISILFQQGTVHFQGYKMAFLLVSFLLAFFYTDDMAGKMISPAKPHRQSTISELLNNGYKIVKHRMDKKDRTWQQFADQLQWLLKSEKFKGNILLSDYWRNYTDDAVTTANTISQDTISSIFKPKSVLMEVANKPNCHYLRKKYIVGPSYIRTFAINRLQISNILNRLYFDSGVRMFWANLINLSDIRKMSKIKGGLLEAKVAAMNVDDRVKSLMLLLIGLLSVSLIVFLVEVFPVGRRLFKASKFKLDISVEVTRIEVQSRN